MILTNPRSSANAAPTAILSLGQRTTGLMPWTQAAHISNPGHLTTDYKFSVIFNLPGCQVRIVSQLPNRQSDLCNELIREIAGYQTYFRSSANGRDKRTRPKTSECEWLFCLRAERIGRREVSPSRPQFGSPHFPLVYFTSSAAFFCFVRRGGSGLPYPDVEFR